MKEKSRQIESRDKRTVHFLFNPGVPNKISPFAKRYRQFLDGTLKETEASDKERFEGFIQRLMGDELEEGEKNPIEYGDMPYFNCELTGGINRLSFSTADDPFYKTSLNKYYPEAVIVSQEGEILGKINPQTTKNDQFAMNFVDDIRDPILKINDDRKIQITLGGIKEPGTMILLLVKDFDNRGKPTPKEGEFDRAWCRLSNEETNQTIDYTLIKSIEVPEDY
mmetsp:Transcript_39051/g.59497  ORF Transcript_39051/g.59497 Transcript_39051/m.59497 type:complete len:223 (+) Transcript_39051:1043-1711(+)